MLIKYLRLLLLLSPAAEALELKLERASSSAEFQAVGKPNMLKIKGKDAVPQGGLVLAAQKGQGQITVELDAFTTGIATRDEHMKEKYLETKLYPKAVLEIVKLDPPLATVPQADGTYNGKLVGTLSLHGTKKAIEAPLRLEWAKGKFSADSSFTLQLSDYKIAVPSFAGVSVADTVDIAVHAGGTSTP